MVKENTELMAEARESLSGNWGLAIATFLVYGIIISIFQVIPKVKLLCGHSPSLSFQSLSTMPWPGSNMRRIQTDTNDPTSLNHL